MRLPKNRWRMVSAGFCRWAPRRFTPAVTGPNALITPTDKAVPASAQAKPLWYFLSFFRPQIKPAKPKRVWKMFSILSKYQASPKKLCSGSGPERPRKPRTP